MQAHHGIHHTFDVNNVLWIFDMDGTLVKTKSGNKFPRDLDDFKVYVIPETNDPVNILIYTNQKKCPEWMPEKIKRIISIVQEKCPNAIIRSAVARDDHERKPIPFAIGKVCPVTEFPCVVMVGDAAGRRGDFSDTDLKFAINIKKYYSRNNVYFFIPEAVPKNDLNDTSMIRKYYKEYIMSSGTGITYPELIWDPQGQDRLNHFVRNKKIILLCGQQGSGKSTICRYLSGTFEIIPYSTTSLARADLALRGNKNVIIDGTFPGSSVRDAFMSLDPNHFGIIYMDLPDDVCKHNRIYRETVLNYEEHVPQVAVSKFKGKLDVPGGPNVLRVTVPLFPETNPKYGLFYY